MSTHLTTTQMKELVRNHFEDFVNNKKPEVIRKNMTPDFLDHNGPSGKPTGIEGDEAMMIGMHNAMPDLHLTIEDMVAEGDKVVCKNIWRWTDRESKKKWNFMDLSCGVLKAKKSQNDGPPLLNPQLKLNKF